MRKPRKPPVKAKGGGAGRGKASGSGGAFLKPGRHHKSIAHHPAHHHLPPGGSKGSGSGAPAPSKKPAPAKKPKKRTLSPGYDIACCTAEAVGTLLGWDWERVLELYWRTASDPDSGASILDTLRAAAEVHELAMHSVREHANILKHQRKLHALEVGELDVLEDVAVALLDDHPPEVSLSRDGHGGDVGWRDPALVLVHPLILGVELPGPHAIAVTPDGTWWSWGQPFDPSEWPELVVEEAWQLCAG